ncbi:hypothetical protein DEO72_LG2g4221 [Vigna unguiculata]|uniref:Uncharacterized protein n=1 Tax=Vigna unguiculata TaxID=3917 RepID=A0A4D6L5T8_VIGUN|nr:hypothetical protein DEO72_LG2g4221 [Vigna unguiculata]
MLPHLPHLELLTMIRIQLLFVLHTRASMLDRLHQRCMSLNLAPNQVCEGYICICIGCW